MDPKGIFEALQAKFGEQAVFDFHPATVKTHESWFCLAPEHFTRVALYLRDTPDLAFNYLECLSGVDLPEQQKLQVVYHLFSYQHKHRVVVKVPLDRAAPKMASACGLWSAANWQERECFDLFGVQFEGHPDLRRILLPEDWTGFPLRKDYQQESHYHGIPTTRPDPLTLLSSPKPAAKAVEKPAAEKPAAKADKPAADKPAEAKPAEAKPADKPAADKPAEAKLADKPAEAKPAAEPKPAESASAEAPSAPEPPKA